MDNLSELPPGQSKSTPQEEAVMDQFFGPAEMEPTSKFSRIEWKLLGATVVLFIALANPWIDQILCKVPYCGGSQLS